jgi:hypothetical protein
MSSFSFFFVFSRGEHWVFVSHINVGEVSLTLVLMGNFIYPTDLDRSLNETADVSVDKNLQYLLLLQDHRETQV